MSEAAGAERLAFDSDSFPPAERFQNYCDSNGSGVTACEAGPAFRARIARWRLDRTVLHDRHLNDVIHKRTAAHAAATVQKLAYIGGKRYLKLLADFSGTHGTGTPISATVIKECGNYEGSA